MQRKTSSTKLEVNVNVDVHLSDCETAQSDSMQENPCSLRLAKEMENRGGEGVGGGGGDEGRKTWGKG